MPTDTFTALGTVDHGRLTLRDPDTFREAMRHVPDGEVVVSVGEVTPRKRTLAQNSFYWVLCEALAKDTGQDKKQFHAYFSTCFLSEPITLVNAAGEIVAEQVVVRSTTGLSAEEFSEYVDRCALCAAETFHFVLPARPGREAAA